jgi:hypothetical protein
MAAEHGDLERRIAAEAGAQYVDVTSWLCSSVCTALVGDMDVYLNQDHITATYATYLSGALEAAVSPMLLAADARPAAVSAELVAPERLAALPAKRILRQRDRASEDL